MGHVVDFQNYIIGQSWAVCRSSGNFVAIFVIVTYPFPEQNHQNGDEQDQNDAGENGNQGDLERKWLWNNANTKVLK